LADGVAAQYLDARGYRRLLQELSQRLKLGFKFYGETALKRLGAGAFLAVARGNGTRDAGIAHLSYRPRGAASPAVSLVVRAYVSIPAERT